MLKANPGQNKKKTIGQMKKNENIIKLNKKRRKCYGL